LPGDAAGWAPAAAETTSVSPFLAGQFHAEKSSEALMPSTPRKTVSENEKESSGVFGKIASRMRQ